MPESVRPSHEHQELDPELLFKLAKLLLPLTLITALFVSLAILGF